MRILSRLALAAAFTAGVTAAATAQDRPRQPGGGFGGGMMGGGTSLASTFGMVANNKALQDELKIGEEQVTKIKDAVKPIADKSREAMQGLFTPGERPNEETMKKIRDAMAKVGEETKTAIEGALKPEQIKRLKEIGYQRMGPIGAIDDKDAAAALKLNDEQKDKFKGLVETYNKDVAEIRKDLPRAGFGGGGGGGGGRPVSEEDRKKQEDARKKTDALKKETEEKIAEKLTDDQKKAWKDMTGEKFDLTKLQQRPMRKDS